MWPLTFISEADFTEHVHSTIRKYGDKLAPYNLEKLNRNTIDPIKLVFDKSVYGLSWDEIVKSEIARQRDKSNNNDIGYFHQRIFQYMQGCIVPDNGSMGGWDVIVSFPDGLAVSGNDIVHKVYVEMKNKHNTMNSSASGKTYIKMQHQLLQDDDCACFLVEAIAKCSQNIKWQTMVNKTHVSHQRIRRVSMDEFYALVTGQKDAFYQMCMVLPSVISKVIGDGIVNTPHDTAMEELRAAAAEKNISLEMAAYLLGFGSYYGFAAERTPAE